MSECRNVRVTQDKQTGVNCNARPECSPSLPQLYRETSASVVVTSDSPSSITEYADQLTAIDKTGYADVTGQTESEQPIILCETMINENNKNEGWETKIHVTKNQQIIVMWIKRV
ncbi:unnamed protein product [Parnassius apollo]|uniref:(apollo) hypothetical protein n=1 Tax=Parnassius apollo TaxID=110799 RepID=A0A8S3YE79_PARAO|nr:unnamed protein product [Parnassius apollo]